LVIHVEGATIPGAPNLPEYIKADVYLPPHLVDERPECHVPIAAMVQTFIEEIGIPTVNRYMAAGRKFGWTFTQSPSSPAIPSSQNLALIPSPAKTGSAHYIFRGRPYGSIPLLSLPPERSNSNQCQSMPASPTGTTLLTPLTSQSESIDEYFPDEPDPVELAMINAAEKMADLESRLDMAALRETNYIKEISNLRNELAESYATLRQQEARFAEGNSYSSTQSSLSSTQRFPSSTQYSPSFPHLLSPFGTPQPSKGKSSVARFTNLAHVSSPGHPEMRMSMSPSPSLHETLRRTRPKPEGDNVTTDWSSDLGFSTTEFIKSHNLTQFGPTITLIVKNYSPTKWSSMLGMLALSDSVRNNLLEALTADLEA
jgi:hypothetical protein